MSTDRTATVHQQIQITAGVVVTTLLDTWPYTPTLTTSPVVW